MVKWPFKWPSDLQLGYQKVTLNHLLGVSPKVSKNWLEALLKSKSWKKFLPTLTLSEGKFPHQRCRLSTRTCVNLLRFLGIFGSEILCWVIFLVGVFGRVREWNDEQRSQRVGKKPGWGISCCKVSWLVARKILLCVVFVGSKIATCASTPCQLENLLFFK